MNYTRRTVVSVPRPPELRNGQSICEVFNRNCLLRLGAGGRGAETTVLLEGRIHLDKNKTLVTQSSVRFTVLLTMQIII